MYNPNHQSHLIFLRFQCNGELECILQYSMCDPGPDLALSLCNRTGVFKRGSTEVLAGSPHMYILGGFFDVKKYNF